MSVLCEKQGDQLGMYSVIAAEIPSEKTAYQLTVDRCVISREMYVVDLSAT